MLSTTLISSLFLGYCFATSAESYEYKYATERDAMQKAEKEFSGYSQILNEDEKVVNNYLEYLKWREFERTRDRFLPSRPIKTVIDEIKSSNVYRLLRKLPKGGNLHLHHNHVVDKELLLELIRTSPVYEHLYVKAIGDDQGKLDIFLNPPEGWLNVKANEEYYTKERLLQPLTLLSIMNDTLVHTPTDSEMRWAAISPLFSFAGSNLINHQNITALYMKAIMESALDENVQYVETKSSASKKTYVLDADPLYEETNGKRYIGDDDGEFEIKICMKEVESFKAEHPEFIGYKRIINSYRGVSKETMKEKMLRALRLYNEHPEFIAGFDMVGEEDRGYSLVHFMEEFANLAVDNLELPYYFHAGETNWPEDLLTSLHADDPVSTLENVYDAIILGVKRIGHGIGFLKHPYLLDMLKRQRIAIEANPVSNMMLGYVPDQRHHPAITFMRSGVPVIIGADDPSTFGYNEVTVDWYEAFMSWGMNLADMKQLANNSLMFSAMSESEKSSSIQKWDIAWNKFIEDTKIEACSSVDRSIIPTFSEIFPTVGPISGGTKVRVFGRNFESAICRHIICRFGDYTSRGVYVYNNMITCESPIRADSMSGQVPFKISFDNGSTYYDTNNTYTFVDIPSSGIDVQNLE